MIRDGQQQRLGELVTLFAVRQGRRTATLPNGATLTVSLSDFGNSSVQLRGARTGVHVIGDEMGYFTAHRLRRVGGLWRTDGVPGSFDAAIEALETATTQQQAAA